MRPDGTEQHRLSDGSTMFTFPRFSKDGRRIVCMHQKDGNHNALWVMERDGRNRTQIVEYRTNWHPIACWSPDGKRLAVVDHAYTAEGAPTDYRLDVMNVDGSNRRTLLKGLWMSQPDWR
jgi:Tol biopolymer transport system component